MTSWTERLRREFLKTEGVPTDKTDKTPIWGLSSVSSVPPSAVFENSDGLSSVLSVPTPLVFEKQDVGPAANDAVNGTRRPPGLSPKLLAASLALDAQIEAQDRLRGTTVTHGEPSRAGRQADLTAARLHQFVDRGLSHADAKDLADRLALRGADDDRRTCLECGHLGGYGRTGWRCGNWQAAGISSNPRHTALAPDLATLPQRCAGFALSN